MSIPQNNENQDEFMSNQFHTIHRHNYEAYYTVMPNSIYENEGLTWGAKGLLSYLLSRPANWVANRSHLAQIYKGDRRGCGIEAINSLFNELIKFGYIVYTQKCEKTGKYIHRYDVYPEPFEDFQKKYPQRVKPCMGKPRPGETPPLTSNDLKTSNEEELSVADEPVGPPPDKIKIKVKGNRTQELSQSDVFRAAITKHKDWKTDEISKAWQILANYGNIVHDWYRFIEGTIEKIRLAQKGERAAAATKNKNDGKTCNKKNNQKQESYKKESSATDTPEHPSPKSPISLGEYVHRLRNGLPLPEAS